MWPLHNSASLIGGVQEGVQEEREGKKTKLNVSVCDGIG